MAEESDNEKTEEPSQYRLEEFRSKGQVAFSRELNSIIALFATTLTLILSSIYILEIVTEYFEWAYNLNYDQVFLNVDKFKVIISKSVITLLKATAPIFISTICIGIISSVMQTGFIFAPEVLSWKFERVNPLNGIGRLFSSKTLIETIKGILKLGIVIGVVYVVIKKQIWGFSGLLHVSVPESFIFAKVLFNKLSFSILLGLLIVAIGDFAWEKYKYRQQLLLTKQEAKEELKEREGNPEIRQRIRAVQREMSRKRMMAKVPEADVIVANPTHISVAIKYDINNMVAPVVLAKGADHLALKIREVAQKHNIPVVENVNLARTLYKTVKIGEAIPRTLYKAVAEILAFVYKKRKKRT